MTINEQLHNSATHAKGFDAACPVCREASPLRARLHDDEQRKIEAIAQFPETFNLAAYEGLFRISPSASYVNDAGVVMLYTQIQLNGQWRDFCKGTVRELQQEFRPVKKSVLDEARERQAARNIRAMADDIRRR